MLNFSHEIPCPEDRALRKFLWFSYFHDGEILSVEPGDNRTVTLTVLSVRDADALFDSLRGTYEEKLAQFERLKPRATYLLRFHGVRYFRHTMEGMIWSADEILTTRFKDTPLRRRLEKEYGKPLYHLQAETSRGLLDVVFERFAIRKQEGRVDYRCDWNPTIDDWLYWVQEIINDADENGSSVKRDNWRFARLYHLHVAEDYPALLTYARKLLDGPDDDLGLAHPYAAHLLGHYGDGNDLPRLTRLYLSPQLYPLDRQTVLDAMERIQEREVERP